MKESRKKNRSNRLNIQNSYMGRPTVSHQNVGVVTKVTNSHYPEYQHYWTQHPSALPDYWTSTHHRACNCRQCSSRRYQNQNQYNHYSHSFDQHIPHHHPAEVAQNFHEQRVFNEYGYDQNGYDEYGYTPHENRQLICYFQEYMKYLDALYRSDYRDPMETRSSYSRFQDPRHTNRF